jgi:hypothetical protein
MRYDTRPLLTAPSMVGGSDRDNWARQGFVAADMETGLLAERSFRVATIRVVLDSPLQDISPLWQRPWLALLRPQLWPQLLWLGHAAPRYSVQAARALQAGLGALPESIRSSGRM